MRVLIACEESQEVCKAFRELGHEAYSCDLQECSGGHLEWHLQVDALEMLKMRWDLIIAHPPCTYISNAGARWLYAGGKLNEDRYLKDWMARLSLCAFWKPTANGLLSRIRSLLRFMICRHARRLYSLMSMANLGAKKRACG